MQIRGLSEAIKLQLRTDSQKRKQQFLQSKQKTLQNE
jgi:hypothetical protein